MNIVLQKKKERIYSCFTAANHRIRENTLIMSASASLKFVLFSVCLLIPLSGNAQSWPDRPIRLIVPFSAGGTNDLTARVVAEKVSSALGQPIVVENRVGAGGSIGADAVAKSAPDGYTLLQASGSTHGGNSAVYPTLPYDPLRDFAPITMLVRTPFILAVHPSVPANNVRELVALAKAEPGKLNYASFGSGSSSHLVGELFKAMAGVDIVHVPFKGSAPAVVATVSGQTQVIFDVINTSGPHIKAGRLKALAVGTPSRSTVLPEAPTVAESGIPGFEATVFFGWLAPAGTPRVVIDRLHREVVRALALPDVREKLAGMGNEIVGNTPEQFSRQITAEVAQWQKLVRERGLKFD
jgi:tripartite-type tricarboxylate transporter receptor subunit TctC